MDCKQDFLRIGVWFSSLSMLELLGVIFLAFISGRLSPDFLYALSLQEDEDIYWVDLPQYSSVKSQYFLEGDDELLRDYLVQESHHKYFMGVYNKSLRNPFLPGGGQEMDSEPLPEDAQAGCFGGLKHFLVAFIVGDLWDFGTAQVVEESAPAEVPASEPTPATIPEPASEPVVEPVQEMLPVEAGVGGEGPNEEGGEEVPVLESNPVEPSEPLAETSVETSIVDEASSSVTEVLPEEVSSEESVSSPIVPVLPETEPVVVPEVVEAP